MIAYRDATRRERTDALLDRLFRRIDAGDAAGLLIELGELEQGVVDERHPDRDGWGPIEERLRAAARAAGAAYTAARSEPAVRPDLRRAGRLLQAVDRAALPDSIRVKLPEGYGHYALDPAAYAAAAERYVREAGERRASDAVVIGLRSIGTSLSAVVAATLGSERSVTVRPRGGNGHRRVEAARSLLALLDGWLADDPDVLIVDEGPGATGATFESVAAWVRARGVAPERIALVPSHTGGMSVAPADRREWFERARKYVPPNADGRVARMAAAEGLTGLENLSAGRWRTVVGGAEELPARTGFERLKHRARNGQGAQHLIRFAGLGHWGEQAVGRAEILADIGIGPSVDTFRDGFVIRRWVAGRPVRRTDTRTPAFREALAGYLDARAGRFRTGAAVDVEPIQSMLRANTERALGDGASELGPALERLEALPAREAVVPDARMQPREWLHAANGNGTEYVKVDAVDHGDGVRQPGPTDAAWDLAGAAVEYGLDDAAVAELVRRCAQSGADAEEELSAAVAAYRAPYAAAGMGDATVSAREAEGEADRRRLAAEATRYRAALAREFGRVGGGA